MVPPAGNDPALEIGFRPTASASWATAAWCMWKDSNLHCAGFEAVASAVGLHMRLGAPSEIRTHTARVLSAMPPAVGLPARGAPYRLRSCVCALPKRCPAIERREPGAGRRNRTSNLCLVRAGERSERPARTLHNEPRRLLAPLGGAAGTALPIELCQRKKDKRTALLLRISEERQSHERRPISGRSRCQTARPSLANSNAVTHSRAR
jgi:hypothetical protein